MNKRIDNLVNLITNKFEHELWIYIVNLFFYRDNYDMLNGQLYLYCKGCLKFCYECQLVTLDFFKEYHDILEWTLYTRKIRFPKK